MSTGVKIVALAARTPVGVSAESSASAVRAGLSRYRESPFIGRTGEQVVVAANARLDPLVEGHARVAPLAQGVLSEICPARSNVDARTIPVGASQRTSPNQQGLRKASRGGGRASGRPARYLLSGLAKCGRCGGAMLVANGHDGRKAVKVYSCSWYKNRGLAGCTNSLRKPMADVDTLVLPRGGSVRTRGAARPSPPFHADC